MIDHGALTDMMLDAINARSKQLVGDGIAPEDGGWLKGQPNESVFVPYVVLVDAGSQAQDPTFCLAPDYLVNWSLRFFAGSRKQCDWIAGMVRPHVLDIEKIDFGADPVYTVVHTRVLSLGAVQRVDSTNPPFWQASDAVQSLCSPRRAKLPRSAVPSDTRKPSYYSGLGGR